MRYKKVNKPLEKKFCSGIHSLWGSELWSIITLSCNTQKKFGK